MFFVVVPTVHIPLFDVFILTRDFVVVHTVQIPMIYQFIVARVFFEVLTAQIPTCFVSLSTMLFNIVKKNALGDVVFEIL